MPKMWPYQLRSLWLQLRLSSLFTCRLYMCGIYAKGVTIMPTKFEYREKIKDLKRQNKQFEILVDKAFVALYLAALAITQKDVRGMK